MDRLFQFAQHYGNYGTYPDGRSMIEQDERLMVEMDTIQQLITYKRWEIDPNRDKRKKAQNGYQLLEQDVFTEVSAGLTGEFTEDGTRVMSMEEM